MSGPGAPHAEIVANTITSAVKAQYALRPFRRRREGMKSRKSPAKTAIFPLAEERTAARGTGAEVCTIRFDHPPPPVSVGVENAHVVFAGNCVQLSVTGRLKPAPGVMVTVYVAGSPV